MRDCYLKAGLDPTETTYFEAHGTGTKIGDPIEVGAIATVFQNGRSANQPLLMGSVKTTIGHTEAASGLAGIIKVVLSMERGIIPASVNFENPNPELALESSNLQVVTKAQSWPVSSNSVRRASINSFGDTGTNAHVIVESADSFLPRSKPPQPSQKYKTKILVLSAKSEEACKNSISNLKVYLTGKKGVENEEALLENLMYTLGQRRTLFPWVSAYRVPFSRGINEVIKALDSSQFKPSRISLRPRIGMVFTGQGAQWHAMGRELIIAYPPFKASLEEGETYLKELDASWSLLEELHREPETTRVNEIAMSIPICVALQISLVRLLRAWGVIPTAVTSHSSGEIAAAYTVGALSYRSAMAVAYYRAILTAERISKVGGPKGGMIAIGVGIEDTNVYLSRLKTGKAVAACINSPSSVTVAGDVSGIQEIEDMAKNDGIFARKLRVETAYHSHHMDPVAEPYRVALENHGLGSLDGNDNLDTIAFSSAVTGGRIYTAEELSNPNHWVESLTQPVLFVDAVSDMILGDFDPSGTSVDAIIEIGPHSALGGPIKEIIGLPEFNGIQIPYYSCLVRNTNARDSIQDLVANLLREGHPFDLNPVNFPWGKWPHVQVLSDLPSYPWDHKLRHWHESRLTKAIRERSQPPNELLGSPAPWSNPTNLSWRQIFRINDSPWTRDHVVDSSILYPAAGFICRAIEAMVQIARGGQAKGAQPPVKGYLLRDFNIQQALLLSENDQGVEIETILTPCSDKAIALQGWMQFVVASVTTGDAKWTQHATGMILADFGDDYLGFNDSKTNPVASSYLSRTLGSEDFYGSMKSSGIKYGPTFQNIKHAVQSIKYKQSETSFGIADTSTSHSIRPCHIIHPTTLDSAIQAAYTTLPEAQIRQGTLKVPQGISELWVSAEISRDAGHNFIARALRHKDDARSMKVDITVVDGNQQFPVLRMEGLVLRSIGSERPQAKPWEKEICSKVEWAEDMSLATSTNVQTLKQQFSTPLEPNETQILMELRRVCIYFITDALAELSESDLEHMEDHHKKYYLWMKDQLQLAKDGNLGPDSAQWVSDSPEERLRRIEETSNDSVNGEMTCQLGPHLSSMLRRKIAPLEVMMEGKLLYKYYSHMLKSDRSFQHAATLLQKLVHKNPRARILEIGAGTGGETRYALKALGTAETGGPRASLYHFTDVSAAFFEAAAVEFSEWREIMQYNMLDVEKDPSGQGFEIGSYDIVIACQVLHATKSMANTMANVRKLLKPGGSLLMVETTKDQVDVQFVFGLVPGWWLSEEEERTSSPSLSIPFWDKILKGAGFTGVDLEVHDCESEELYSFSTIMATAQPSQPQKLATQDVIIVTCNERPLPDDWKETLLVAISGQNGTPIPVRALNYSDASMYAGKICVFLGELNQPLLRELTAAELEGIKAMATSCKGLLWVTRGGAVECKHPEYGLAAGLMRTLRNEYVGRKFLTLDLDPKALPWSQASSSAILQVLRAEFGSTLGSSAYESPNEFEYAERDGCILIPRLQKSTKDNESILPEPVDYSAKEEFSVEPFHQVEYPLSLQVGVPGLLETLAFDRDVRPEIDHGGSIAEDMVQIQPHAYGLNRRDVLVALDQLDERTMGLECAGIITKVGSVAASHGFAPGDRVFGLLQGPIASRGLTEWTNFMRIPSAYTFEEAASIPVAFGTAYIGLCDIGRLQQGQSVLIHSAADAVGQAAIMIAQKVGARIFATVSLAEKKALIMNKYGIPEEQIFSSRDTSFTSRVLSATKGNGVDVVLNTLSGPLLQASRDVVAPFGHFIETGSRDFNQNSSLHMRYLARQISFSSVNLLSMMVHRPEQVHRVLTEVTRMLTEKNVTTVWPITAYPAADIVQAFERISTGKSAGKVVLRTGIQETVPVLPRRQTIKLSPNASYLLVGGVGGIGRSIATWMIDQGAKNLILLSRSAGDSQKTAGFVNEVTEGNECRIKTISCDVSNASDLAAALKECEREGLPPVRGIIQAAMVLQVRIAVNLVRLSAH